MRMKYIMVIAIGFCLLAALGRAQVNEAGPASGHAVRSLAKPRAGDELFFQDLETPTGDIRLLGIGFDGTSYWATGAFDMTTAYLYQFDSSWNLTNSFVTGKSSWGWRDLSFDGIYLYASDSYVIDQINRSTGTATGTTIPSPISPARALAYDPVTDTFWTASWSSDIYNVNRVGTYISFGNTLGEIYGMGWDDRDPASPMLWIWSQDGSQDCQASEFDPLTGTFTGTTWSGSGGYGIAGGCDVYEDPTYGWMLLGMHQGAPDGAAGYTLTRTSLYADVEFLYSPPGGVINFDLDAGSEHAGRSYALLGSFHGTSPGIRIGNGYTLPLNSDGFFQYCRYNGSTSPLLENFQGTLDANGQASASFICMLPQPGFHVGMVMSFAYLTLYPFDFASNPVNVEILPQPADYRYDDGSTENLLGWYSSGDMCWMHRFDELPDGGTIASVQTIWGSAMYPGYHPPDGTAAKIYVWDDPTDDGDPSDVVLLTAESVTVQNVDTDIMNTYPLMIPVTISGEFYVGVMITQSAGQYVIPMDQSTLYIWGNAFYCGTPGAPGTFDPVDIMNNQVTPSEYGSYWCLRAGF